MSLAKNYIEINGNTFFSRAVTGMIQPIPDMYQPSLFVIKRIFPYKHHHTKTLINCGTGHRGLGEEIASNPEPQIKTPQIKTPPNNWPVPVIGRQNK